jgi:hypothetical protein
VSPADVKVLVIEVAACPIIILSLVSSTCKAIHLLPFSNVKVSYTLFAIILPAVCVIFVSPSFLSAIVIVLKL